MSVVLAYAICWYFVVSSPLQMAVLYKHVGVKRLPRLRVSFVVLTIIEDLLYAWAFLALLGMKSHLPFWPWFAVGSLIVFSLLDMALKIYRAEHELSSNTTATSWLVSSLIVAAQVYAVIWVLLQ